MIKKTGSVISDLLVGQDGEAAVMSFDHRIEVLQDFTRDLNKIDAALDKLKPGGMNNRLVDAVKEDVQERAFRLKQIGTNVFEEQKAVLERGAEGAKEALES